MAPPGEPATKDPAALREVANAKRPFKKTCHASSSVTPGPDVWTDLLDCLLHQIIALLNSFSDLLAFNGTCRSWRAALSSFPSTFTSGIPPLYLQPHIHYPHRNRSCVAYSLLYNCEWQLTDPANKSFSRCCSPPQNHPTCMHYLGCSFGYLIFYNSGHCLLVDVSRGTTVRPPRVKSAGSHEVYYGILNGPINSPNSYLLLCSRSSIFQWQVGSNSWLEHPIGAGRHIIQIVFFKGETYTMDHCDCIRTIRLEPQLSVQDVEIDYGEYWEEIMVHNPMNWFVVSDDKLLLVDLCMRNVNSRQRGTTSTFRVFHLDFSSQPAKCVKVEDLGNHAIFVSFDARNTALCCKNPERWGGKSNYIYVATQSKDSDEPWTMVKLDQAVPCRKWRCIDYPDYSDKRPWAPDGDGKLPENLWVLPSLVYDIGC
ncbi:unnamed protein product [Urochloa humidicola]